MLRFVQFAVSALLMLPKTVKGRKLSSARATAKNGCTGAYVMEFTSMTMKCRLVATDIVESQAEV